MSQYNDPGKLEAALVAVAAGVSVNIYSGDAPATAVAIRTGQDDEELGLPSVVCEVVESGPEVVKDTGIYQSTVVIRATSSGNVTLAEHRARAGAIFDAFKQTTIAATLAAAVDDFFCYEVKGGAPGIERKEPRDSDAFAFVSELTLEVVWCGSDIS